MSDKPKRKWMKKAKAAEAALENDRDKGKLKSHKGKTRSDRIASMYGKKHG